MTKVVVIDPGHGGRDSGAVAVDGGLEKHWTLEMAQAIRWSLRERYLVEVVLTRETDTEVSPAKNWTLAGELWARAQIATKHQADLLFSVHFDSGVADARGGSTYVWTDARTPDGGLRWLPATGNHKDPKSQPLALAIVKEVRPVLADFGVPWRSFGDAGGISCADFGVLRHTARPAVLTEYFFGSNRADCAAARSQEFTNRLATATADGIARALGLERRRKLVPIVLPGGAQVSGENRDGTVWVEVGGVDVPVRELNGLTVRWHGPDDGGPRIVLSR